MEKKKSKKKLLIIISAVILVVLGIIVGFFFNYLENRELFSIINPEVVFGGCVDIDMDNSGGMDCCTLTFEANKDFRKKVDKYVELVGQVDRDLQKISRPDEDETELEEIWSFVGDEFWPEYSFRALGQKAMVLEYYKDDDIYVLKIQIYAYSNCDLLPGNPYERKDEVANEPAQNYDSDDATDYDDEDSYDDSSDFELSSGDDWELISEAMDTGNMVDVPDNAFQDLYDWSNGLAFTEDMEDADKSIQYIEYSTPDDIISKYMEMLKQNGFSEAGSSFFQYEGDPFVSWGFNCDALPDARKVALQYEDDMTCHLCIWSSREGEYHFEYSSDLTKYDLGLRMDGGTESTSVQGPSAGAGLYRAYDGTYKTSDERLQASVNKAMVLRDGEVYYCDARCEIDSEKKDEWLWIEDYYRNEGICFKVPMNSVMTGDVFQYNNLVRDHYYNEPDDKTDVYCWEWGGQPLFLATVNGSFVGPEVSDYKFDAITVRVMYYEKNQEAVYYIYAKTSGDPSELEALCVVSLGNESTQDFDDTIRLSVGDTYTIHFSETVFGATSNVYEWEVTDGDSIRIDGVTKDCEVTAKEEGESTVTLVYKYTVNSSSILTGLPTTDSKSKKRVYRISVE